MSDEYLDKSAYIKKIRELLKYETLLREIELLKNIKVLIIGDTIIDTYTYVAPKGRAIKDPILSTEFKREESYAGGVLAVANHQSSYLDKIKLVTLIGDQNPQLDFITKSLAKNIELKTFTKKNSPTIVKKRYIDIKRNSKLFKVEYMNDLPISKELSEEIVNYLSDELPKYDLVLVLDYDHGFINESIRKVLQEKSKFLALNVQTNSANMGYNYMNKYNRADFISMNDQEIRLPLMMRFEDMQQVISEFHNRFNYDKFLVTLSKEGCAFFNQENKHNAPIFTDKVVDTVGAGDSVFAITSLFVYFKFDDRIIPFVANCAGGIGANIIGNKEFVTKDKLLNFIKQIYELG